FNHKQIKNATTTGFLLIKKQNFHEIANRIVNLPLATLESLITQLTNGRVKPESDEEKECFKMFKIINDLQPKCKDL
ncbi:uncharacterized protein LAESUDRAFT_648245, partial [Laetiporus sulphureus 93-53]